MATSRYLQPRQPGGRSSADTQQEDPNGVYIPGREGRLDARPRNALYLPGTGPGTGRTGIRTGIVNRDGTTSPLSSMGYATGPLSPTRPSSLPGAENSEADASNASAPSGYASNITTSRSSRAAETDDSDADTSETSTPQSSTPNKRELNPNAPLVYNPISLDNPGGNFVMQGATIADSSYMPDESGNEAPQGGSTDNEAPRKRIDARPRNNIYMPGTGPGTGRTAIRIGTINRDGSESPVSSMGYATGPLSETRPSSLPATKTKGAPGNPAATPGLPETIKDSTRQFGSNGEQNLKAPTPLTPAVIPSTIDLPSNNTPKTAPNAITPGVSGTIKASTEQFGSQPGAAKPASPPAIKPLSSDLDTLKTSTPALGSTPPLNTKAPALSLTPSLGGISTPKPSTGLDTIGASSKPFGSTSPSGPLDLTGIKKRAKGGPVRAGQPYLVGEEGPELIIPKRSGTVVPNHALQAEGQTTGLMMRPRPVPAEYARHHALRNRGKAKDKPRGDGKRKTPQHR